MGCGPSAAAPIQDGYVFRIEGESGAQPEAAPPTRARGDSLKKVAADAAPETTSGKSVGKTKWANARNAVNGANAFQQGGFRKAARDKYRQNSEHGWLAKDIHLGPGVNAGKFEFGRVIGTGLMGTVRIAYVKKEQQYCVIKSVAKDYVCKHNDGRHVRAEREILTRLDHPFIVQLFGTYQDDKRIHFVLEFVAGGELFSRLQRHSCFACETAKFYLCEVFLALSYIHQKGYVYRDLKPENILLDEAGHCKLVDFGFATKPNDVGVMRTQVGTPMYLSPEQLNSKFTKGYTRIVDWWAFACITYELMVGLTPFCRDNKESAHAIYLRVLNGKVRYPSHFDRRAKDLVSKLLVADVSKRMTEPADIEKHEWFADVNWRAVAERRAVPPSKPTLKEPGDVHYFDEHPEDRTLDRRPLAKIDQSEFAGF